MYQRSGDIRYSPNGPGRFRKIPRRKKVSHRRKPLSPPVHFPTAVIPFHQLAPKYQGLSGKDRAAGERDE